MTQPVAYVPQTDFQEEEQDAVAGRSTVRTAALDAELQAISETISQALANLALIQRDDTALQDEIVTTDSLSPAVKTLISTTGVNPRGAWLTATNYAIKDIVETGTPFISYVCLVAHTSGTFAVDRAAGKWMVMGQEPGAGVLNSVTLSTGGVTLGTNNTQDLASTGNRFRDGWFGNDVTAGGRVITPVITTATDVDLAFRNSALGTVWAIKSTVFGSNLCDLVPANNNQANLGGPANLIAKIYTPIMDTGTAGPLSVRTNNGTEQFAVDHNALAVNVWRAKGGVAAGVGALLYAVGSDTNVIGAFAVKGAGSFDFYTRNDIAAKLQFQVVDAAGSTRNAYAVGSNGGNPGFGTTAGSLLLSSSASSANGITVTAGAGTQTLGVTAGTLTITPAVVVLGSSISVGTTPALSGALSLANSAQIMSRNAANNADLNLIRTQTLNAIPNVTVVGDTTTSAGTLIAGRIAAAGPSVADIPAGSCMMWRDTTAATTKFYYNNGGALVSVGLV